MADRREKYGVPGHCFDIDGGPWHEPGECKAPTCQKVPCCGYTARSEPATEARARILWEAEMDATLKAILTIAEAEANDEWAEVRRFATEARDMLHAAPAPSGVGERRYTLEEINSAVYEANLVWDGRDTRSFSDLVRDELLRSHPTKEDE